MDGARRPSRHDASDDGRPRSPALAGLRDAEPEPRDALLRRGAKLEAPYETDRDDERVRQVALLRVLDVDRDHPEAGLGLEPVEDPTRRIGELDLDDGRR